MHRAWLGHLEVNHIRSVLQGSHRLLVTHILQNNVVHLMKTERRQKVSAASPDYLVSLKHCDNIMHRTSQHSNESQLRGIRGMFWHLYSREKGRCLCALGSVNEDQ